jgi:hypothetical protein
MSQDCTKRFGKHHQQAPAPIMVSEDTMHAVPGTVRITKHETVTTVIHDDPSLVDEQASKADKETAPNACNRT